MTKIRLYGLILSIALIVMTVTAMQGCARHGKQAAAECPPPTHPAAVAASSSAADESAHAEASAAESSASESSASESSDAMPPAAAAARQRLCDGNNRFAHDLHALNMVASQRRKELLTAQHPFAAILCCSDSRVPPELVFDQGLGDVFIIRVAGNVADPDVTASVEYAVEHLHVPLVVVMGHDQCGAVKATMQGGEAPGSIGGLVSKIMPSVDKAWAAGLVKPESVLDRAIEENAHHWAEELKHSPVVHEQIKEGKTAVVSAKYHLDSGKVQWLD